MLIISLGFQPLRIEEEGSGDNAIPMMCRCPECEYGQSDRRMGNRARDVKKLISLSGAAAT